ncbi:MAG: GNAT family N-acetyltransferase [Anaerolineae bacterium]|nr:GNAT family N-acetyltransferase [Anaerolineae bacterium]
MVDGGIAIRQATVADVDDLVRLRRVMCEGMGWDDPVKLDVMEQATSAYFIEAIPAGDFCGWLAVTPAGEAVGAGGVIIDQHIPTPGNPSGKVGYVLNVATVPGHRRRGIARRVLQTILAWLGEQGIQRATLHTSDVGRSLYESLGFEPVPNEMRLEIDQ